MTLAKAVVTGSVYRAPEKRFTTNNVAVSSFILDIGDREQTLIRVISKRASLDDVVSDISKNERVLVEGRLQVATAKMEDGTEKRIYEIEAASVEKMSGSAPSKPAANEEIVKFASEEIADELIGEDEIPF